MADDEKKKLEEEKKRKQAEIERKRAEVRARMEEASKAKKAKKGFMTPERKKKLRLLLRKKAAEELKKEQERKAAERRRIIEERCGKAKLIDEANEGTLKKICKEYYDRMYNCEEQKWDLEREVRKRDWEISDLNSQVNDLRGKFVKPTLKKVSKYENKFAKLQKKAAEFNFRNQLKVVKKKEFTLEEEDKEKKPDWSKKGEEKKEDAAPEESAQAEGEKIPEEGKAAAETPQGEEGAAHVEGATEGPKTEGEPSSEIQTPAEGQPPIEGQPPAEGQPPTEGQPTTEGQPPTEGQAQEEIPPPEPTGFEKFKMIVAEKDYDIIALPEAVIAPTDNKDEVNIPHYSLVEKRKNSGEGVLLYIKDSLRYKVVDFVSDNPDEHPSIDQLVAKLELNGLKSPEAEKIFEEIAAAEASAAAEVAATTTEGAKVTPEGAAPATEGVAPTSEGAAPTSEGAAPTSESTAPTSEEGAKSSEGATEETKTSEPSGDAVTHETNTPEETAAPEETPVAQVADVTPVPTSPMVEAAA